MMQISSLDSSIAKFKNDFISGGRTMAKNEVSDGIRTDILSKKEKKTKTINYHLFKMRE